MTTFVPEWNQEQDKEGEEQGGRGGLNDPQDGQAQALEQGVQVHLHCPDLNKQVFLTWSESNNVFLEAKLSFILISCRVL